MIRQMTWAVSLVLLACVIVLLVLFTVRWVRRAYVQRVLDGLTALEKELTLIAVSQDPRDREAASLMAQVRLVRSHVGKFTDGERAAVGIPQEVKALDEDAALLRDGLEVYPDKRGPMIKGYVSEIDGTLQTYSVNVPEDYLGDRPFALVVQLHGHQWFAPFQGYPPPAYSGAITLVPQGRGATDYLYIGEEDVLAAIEEVKRDYVIDDDRVYLVGHSMGGTGCWTMGVHHPDLFAGIVPIAANADYHAWETRWNWNLPAQGWHTRLRQFMFELDNPLTYAANLRPVPISCLHGAGDEVVPVEHARAMVEAVRAAGGECRYLEFLKGGHGGLPDVTVDEETAWVATHRRQPMTHVRFTTGRLRQGRVAWVKLEALSEPLRLAEVDGELLPENRIRLDLANVSALTLRPPGEHVTGPLTVTVNGQTLNGITPDTEGAVPLLLSAEGKWQVGRMDPKALRKRVGAEGPVDEVFLRPFAVVYGTRTETADDERALVEEAVAFSVEWERRYGGRPRVFSDRDITVEDTQRYSVVFFGRPDQNTALAAFAPRLPIRIERDSITAFGQTWRGPDVGAIFCYPNPYDPSRMLVIYAALGPEGYHQMNTRFGNWFNWGVYDNRKWFDYAVYDARTVNPETYLVAGFFNAEWQYDAKFAFPGIEAVRAGTPVQGFPRYGQAPLDVRELYLDDVRPSAVDQMRGAIGYGRSFHGETIVVAGKTYERGLGVRAPSSIGYEIAGKFDTFRAVAGLSEEKNEGVSARRRLAERVRFVVWGDGKVLWKSDVVDWENPSVEVKAPVRGVQRLTLQVEAEGGALWLHGATAWADARLIRK